MPIESAGEVVFQGGPAGTDGQSTYQAWLALGNVGSIVDFIAAQRGAPGPANVLAIGTVSTGAPGSSASATISGQSPNQALSLTVPQGATGAQPWQTPPTAWAASTAYTAAAPASCVTYSGESYVCATAHTSAQAFDASKWIKIAQKGADGSPAAGAVLYNGAQSLMGSEQSRAKLNIGAPYAGATYLTASRAFTAADNGRAMVVQANGVVMTLPTLASAGLMWNAKYTSWGASFTIAPQPGEYIYYNGASYTSFPVLPGEVVDVYTDTGLWVISLRSPIYDDAPSFNRTQYTSDAQKSQLLANAGLLIPQAQCRLVYVSTGQIKLIPWNGNKIWISGAYRTLPAAGVSLSTAGLGNNTFWPIVAFWTGSAIALSGVNLPIVVDPTYGIRTTQGYPDQTYVGAVLTDANYNFRDDDSFRGVASLFNPPRRTLSGVIAAPGSTASTAGVVLGSPLQFVLAEPAGCSFRGAGNTSNDTATKTCRTDITLDQVAAGYPSFGDGVAPVAPSFSGLIPAGAHAVTLFASVSGGTGSWNAALFGELG